jgi:hypothetical protein
MVVTEIKEKNWKEETGMLKCQAGFFYKIEQKQD